MWIAALRSDEFSQGTGVLRNGNGDYCCLGVLCELHRREMDTSTAPLWWQDYDEYVYLDSDGGLPIAVREWAGLKRTSPPVEIEGYTRTSLAELNDGGRNFLEIAATIEEML